MKKIKNIFLSFILIFACAFSFGSITKAAAWSESLYDAKNDVLTFEYNGKGEKVESLKVSSKKKKNYQIIIDGKEIKMGEQEATSVYEVPQDKKTVISYGFSKDKTHPVYAKNNAEYYVLRLVSYESPGVTSGENDKEFEQVESYELIPYKPLALSRYNPSKVRVGKKIKLDVLMADTKVSWKSANTSIATVKNGKVYGKKSGKVKITASCGSHKVTKTIAVWKVNGIKITGRSWVKAGKSIDLDAKVSCTNGGKSNKVTWKSSNTKYATVNSAGKVTTKKAGKGKTVKITARASDGKNIKKTKKIKIK